MTHAALFTLATAVFALLPPGGPARADQAVNCANPACETRLSDACLNRLGAGSIQAGASCDAEQSAYVACLSAVAERCSTTQKETTTSGCTHEDARQMLDLLKGSRSPEEFEAFAKACAGTPQAILAAARAERLRKAATAAPPPQERATSRTAPPPRVTIGDPNEAPISSAADRQAGPDAFEGEWEVVKNFRRTGCARYFRFHQKRGEWIWGWRGNPQGEYLRIRPSGFHEPGWLRFSNSRSFRIAGEFLIHENRGPRCMLRKISSGPPPPAYTRMIGAWTLERWNDARLCPRSASIAKQDDRLIFKSDKTGPLPSTVPTSADPEQAKYCFAEPGAPCQIEISVARRVLKMRARSTRARCDYVKADAN